jgi:hypothetical protein
MRISWGALDQEREVVYQRDDKYTTKTVTIKKDRKERRKELLWMRFVVSSTIRISEYPPYFAKSPSKRCPRYNKTAQTPDKNSPILVLMPVV